MTPFRERNPIPIAIGGLVVIALLLAATFNLNKLPLPFLGSYTTYRAAFAQAAGIDRDNEVRVAGVRVGRVTGVRLDVPGKRVVVTFQVRKGTDLGDATRAAIKLKTLLGTKYLELTPDGGGRLDPKVTIPLNRTSVPFQIYDAFNQFSQTLDAIDTKRLAQALDTLADTFRDSKGNARSALRGLSSLSRTIAGRDAQLRDLLAGTRKVTAALAARDGELTRLITDADLVVKVVLQRREAVAALLRDTASLSARLTSLVRDDRKHLDPLLDNLHDVVGTLRANLGSLDKAVAALGPFARYTTNATGNGTWLDVYSENLVVSDQVLCAIGAC